MLAARILPNSILLHEDDFYKHDEEVPIDTKYGIRLWDDPRALDFDLFDKELDIIKKTGQISQELIHNNNVDGIEKFNIHDDFVKQLKQKCSSIEPNVKIVIVDGFMIYNNPKVSSKFDLKILIRAPYQVLKRRRAARPGYKTLDSYWVDPPYYFDEFVYKSYKDAHNRLFINNDVEGQLDASTSNDIRDFKNDDDTPIEDAVYWVCQEILSFLNGSKSVAPQSKATLNN